jgi:hypothetical protein
MKNWICKNILLENPESVDNFGFVMYLTIVGFLVSACGFFFVYLPFFFWC